MNESIIRCTRCGADNRANRIFCADCGVYLGEGDDTLDENREPTEHTTGLRAGPPVTGDGTLRAALSASTALAADETQLMPSWMLPVDDEPGHKGNGSPSTPRGTSRAGSPAIPPYWEDAPLSGPIPVPVHSGPSGRPPRRRWIRAGGVLLALLLMGSAGAVGSFVYHTVADGAPTSTTTATTVIGVGASTSTTELVGQVPIPTVTIEDSTTDTTEGNRLDPAEVLASSSLPRTDKHSYDAQNLLDDKLATAWNEDAPGDGEGEWVRFGFAGIVTIARIDIANGYQSDRATYANNPRVRELRLTFSDKSSRRVQLEDRTGYQTIEIEPKKTEWIRMTIVSTYPGEKWTDGSLSEIRFYEAPR